jgi:predicted amidohydrolase YtcJ
MEMRKLRIAPVVCAAFGLILVLFAAAQERPVDLILFNGKIFTSDAAHPYIEAIAIRGDRIAATGDSAKIKSLAGPHTKIIDLAGRTAIPGINDAHNHIDLRPPNLVNVELKSIDSTWTEVKAAVAAAAAKSPSHSLLAVEIGNTVFHDTSVNRDTLDNLAPDNPVVLGTFTGHGFILNTAALRLYGIANDQPDPFGGRFERDGHGKLTGVVREYAGFNIQRYMANQVSDSDAVVQLRQALAEAAKFGITTIQDMSNAMSPGRAVALLEKVPAELRIRVIRMAGTTVTGRDIEEGQGIARHPSPLITVSGTKWMLDGVPVEGTFTPRDQYKLPPSPPYDQLVRELALTFPEKEISSMLQETLRNDDQLLVHVSGYISAKDMLNAMDASGGKDVWATRRVRFEHGDGVFPDLVPRVKAYGIVVVQNPSHLMGVLSDGTKIFEISQPLKSLLAAGIPVALGSDGPTNPYLNIMFATLHTNHPSEAITREQAVVAYTLTSAYAEFAEKEKGSLEPGKLADLAVLSQDIFTVPTPALPGTKSILTMVGGKIVYDDRTMIQGSPKN